jgi:hypothetical protein
MLPSGAITPPRAMKISCVSAPGLNAIGIWYSRRE